MVIFNVTINNKEFCFLFIETPEDLLNGVNDAIQTFKDYDLEVIVK